MSLRGSDLLVEEDFDWPVVVPDDRDIAMRVAVTLQGHHPLRRAVG